MSRNIILLAILFVLVGNTYETEACVFRYRRTRLTISRCNPSNGIQKTALGSHNRTIEQQIALLLTQNGIKQGFIPTGNISLNDTQTYIIAFQWYKIQHQLETLIQKELGSEHPIRLVLVLKEIQQPNGSTEQRFAISRPSDEAITILSTTLKLDNAIFDNRINLIGEVSNFFINEFGPQYLSNGRLNLAKIQGDLCELLQSNKDLAKLAKSANGQFKPIRIPNDLKDDSVRVITQWQELTSSNDIRLYWRANICLEQEKDHWKLETLIDVGERYRSQSFDQIAKITDTNKLGAFDAIESYQVHDNTATTAIRYKVVRSASEKLLNDDARDKIGEMAPALWNQVKNTIFRIKKDE